MPITKGQRNPKWNRDETILALELYFKSDGHPPSRGDKSVLELSKLLRRCGKMRLGSIEPSFRNPDGVALKLQNIHAAITDNKSGLSSSKGDKAIAKEFPFPSHYDEVIEVAASIRYAINSGQNILEQEDQPVFREGEAATRLHVIQERNPKLRKKLLQNRIDKHGKLICEICDFSACPTTNRIFESLFEAHHIVPLSTYKMTKNTTIRDMALLCACCHRLIHAVISMDKRWISIEEARKMKIFNQVRAAT